ncbi:hypothetical protein HNP25_003003 [Arcicella rosea]|uniref:Uncharacterized protein n=1 Tax=Arcicella rosea TaxID=502909 RepID=A0A841EVL0_9BACT|nr:hypothetical protein [Arcicella rosea]
MREVYRGINKSGVELFTDCNLLYCAQLLSDYLVYGLKYLINTNSHCYSLILYI